MQQIAEEVLAAVGGKDNVRANDICMTRLRILTEDPSLVDTDMLSSARGVLGFVRRGTNGLEVVFGPGKAEAVQEALVGLTGIEPSDEVFDALRGAPASSLHVHIAPNPLRRAADAQRTGQQKATLQLAKDDETDVSELMSMLDKMGPASEKAPSDEPDASGDDRGSRARVLVINGPNINMLGIREPDIYGHDTYQALLKTCREAALEAGFSECSCFQSNHEGDLVDAIQDAYDDYDGIVINPGAYTHTSVAILDAAKAVALPMVEVHISKIDEREEFRQVSYIRAACFETIAGMGIEGYRKALFDLAKRIGL
jgi:3-dehydroquinate dehydratase-2